MLSHTKEMKDCSGMKATGRLYVRTVMIRRQQERMAGGEGKEGFTLINNRVGGYKSLTLDNTTSGGPLCVKNRIIPEGGYKACHEDL